ncbi:hypothetical protein A5778_15575 [Mycolicibacterium monacense]|nr:hypothetical protein A5778_15575 [Mycolicibacterium monacense]
MRRIALVDDWVRQNQDRRRETEQALCCECGNLRTCKQPRNYVSERSDLQTWHRMTGDLKCDACGRITRHALLRSGEFRDAAENYQRMALGGEPQSHLEDVGRARREYRLGLPRNPYLKHWWIKEEGQAAWDSGEKAVVALCGETITVERDPRSTTFSTRGSTGELVEPEEVRDMEYEDPETGLWWAETDCVDCLRVSNERRLKRLRKELLQDLLEVSACVNGLGAADVIALREHIDRLLMRNVGGTDRE